MHDEILKIYFFKTNFNIFFYNNYKFPFLTANKVITNGPDKTIRANTVNCATTSKFIINLTLKYFINVAN
jgi:hypothetical protein